MPMRTVCLGHDELSELCKKVPNVIICRQSVQKRLFFVSGNIHWN